MNTRTDFSPAVAARELLTGMQEIRHDDACDLLCALSRLFKIMGHTAAVDFLDCAHDSMQYGADVDLPLVDEDAQTWMARACQ